MTEENRYQPPKAEVADVNVFEGGDELGSRWARLGGSIIDGLLVGILSMPYLFFSDFFSKAMAGQIQIGDSLELVLVGAVVYLLLNGYLLNKFGQTIGKRAADLRVVSTVENRILPLWKVYSLRYLPIQLIGQIPIVGGLIAFIDCLFVFRADKRCLHDFVAGTRVIKSSVPWKAYDQP